MNNNKINLLIYNNVEDVENFKNKFSLSKYRKDKLNETIRRVKFIKKNF